MCKETKEPNEEKPHPLEKKYGKEPIIPKEELTSTRWRWH